MVNDLADKVLKYGSRAQASNSPSTNERKLKSKDSVRNCCTRLLLCEPTTFRSPTSLARLADLAVERLIKLIQAIIRIKQAMAPNNHTKRISPCDNSSWMSYDLRWISLTACKCKEAFFTNSPASF